MTREGLGFESILEGWKLLTWEVGASGLDLAIVVIFLLGVGSTIIF